MNGATEAERLTESQEITSIKGSGPIITLPPNPQYRAYYVLEEQLQQLANAGSSHHQSIASVAIGVFSTVLMTLIGVEFYPTHPGFFIFCLLVALVSGVVALISGILWFRNRKNVSKIIEGLRSQYKESEEPNYARPTRE